MKLKAFIGGIRRNKHTREAGWTFGEVLVVVGVIAALAIGAFAVYTQLGGSTELSQLAGQIGERAGSQKRLIDSGLRSGEVSAREFAASVGTLIANHKFVTGGSGGTALGSGTTVSEVITGTIACTGSGVNSFGFQINLVNNGDNSLSEDQLFEFQGLIIAAIQAALVDDAGWLNTFSAVHAGGTAAGTTGLEDLGLSTDPVFPTTGTVSTIPICINDGN